MRVAYVCTDPGVPVYGCKGASVHVQEVVRVLVARGAQVDLVAARVGGDVPAGLDGVRLHRLPAVAPEEPAAREVGAQASDAAVAGVLDEISAVAPLDLVYERYALWGRTATAWAVRAGVPSLLEVNAPLVAEQAAHRGLHDRVGAERVAVDALSAAGAVACVSDEVAAWARSVSRRPDRVAVVPNGVDVQRIRPGTAQRDSTTFTVGFVGTLKPWHGVELLVDALALLAESDRSYRLLVVGDGPCAGALRERAAAAGVGDLVELTGAVGPDAVPALLHRMDVAAAPYPGGGPSYFSPLKIYEYLAAGLPVVASRVGQVPAALDGGRLGVLVPPGDARSLAGAVAGLRTDPAQRAALGSAARAAAVRSYTWEAVVDRLLALTGESALAVTG